MYYKLGSAERLDLVWDKWMDYWWDNLMAQLLLVAMT